MLQNFFSSLLFVPFFFYYNGQQLPHRAKKGTQNRYTARYTEHKKSASFPCFQYKLDSIKYCKCSLEEIKNIYRQSKICYITLFYS